MNVYFYSDIYIYIYIIQYIYIYIYTYIHMHACMLLHLQALSPIFSMVHAEKLEEYPVYEVTNVIPRVNLR